MMMMMTENHDDDDDYGGKQENENEEKNGYTVPVLYNHRAWKLTVPTTIFQSIMENCALVKLKRRKREQLLWGQSKANFSLVVNRRKLLQRVSPIFS